MKIAKNSSKDLEGIIIVNKPSGMTSHDVVSVARRKLNMRRIGHAGTLDPLATGVLVLLVGKATKMFSEFEAYDKAYRATMRLGIQTTTADSEGETIQQLPFDYITQESILEMLEEFVGEIMQIPPMVSAVKVNGKRLYQLARKGVSVKRTPRKITIRKLDLIQFDSPFVVFSLECSKGTYVRKLAEDVAERLGSVACITQIERTRVGPLSIEQAVELDNLSDKDVQPWSV